MNEKQKPAGRFNILITSDAVPADGEGGAATAMWETAKRLAKRGHTINVLTCGAKGLKRKEEIDGIPVWRFGRNIFSSSLYFRQINKEKPVDVLLTHQPFSASGLMPWLFRKKIPHVHFFYSPWPEEYLLKCSGKRTPFITHAAGVLLRRLMEKIAVSTADAVVVLSDYIKSKLKELYCPPDSKVRLIPGGIDLKKFNPPHSQNEKMEIRKGLNLPQDKFLLLTVRNLKSRMGLENLLLAMQKLYSEFPDIIFLVIGGRGDLETKLKKMAGDLKIEKSVRFTGFIPQEKLPAYYRAADLFVLPTKSLEGFGLVILESLACGTPVMGTPVGAIPEVLAPLDKRLIFNGTENHHIYTGIRDFINRNKNSDPEIIRQTCRGFVEQRYSWEKFTDGVENILYEIKQV
ncbi:MAG: glycosyltransferase family 4 protein [Elusimicrobiota bacterium]